MLSYSSERHLLLIDWSIFMNGNHSEMAICKKVEHILKVKIAMNLIMLILWSHQQQWTHITKCLEWNFWKPHWTPGIFGNPRQYSSLDNPIDRRAWWAIVHGVARVGHDLATTTTMLRGLYSPPTLFTNLEFLPLWKFWVCVPIISC